MLDPGAMEWIALAKSDTGPKTPGAAKSRRSERLAAALKANISRRKAQARGRKAAQADNGDDCDSSRD